MAESSHGMDFEHFEKMPDNPAKLAREFLLSQYPVSSPALLASEYVRAGGARCTFTTEKNGTYYYCKYIRPGHGLMALVSSIEWTVIIMTDEKGEIITDIGVGRGATGP